MSHSYDASYVKVSVHEKLAIKFRMRIFYKSFKKPPSTIITKSSTLDVTAVLDPPLPILSEDSRTVVNFFLS